MMSAGVWGVVLSLLSCVWVNDRKHIIERTSYGK